MTGISMPDESVIPPGPHRDFVTALFELYVAAGTPPLRTISANIQQNNELPGTASRDTVSKLLNGTGAVPTWNTTVSLVRALISMSVRQYDEDYEVKRIHELWTAAQGLIGGVSAIDGLRPCDPAMMGPGPISQISVATQPLARWESPRGVVEFFDRQLFFEMFGEGGDRGA